MDVATIVYVKIIQFEYVSRPGSASAAAADVICEENKPIFNSFSAVKSLKRREKPESSTSDEKQQGSKVTNNYVGTDNAFLLQAAQVGLVNRNAAGEGVQVRLVFDAEVQSSYNSKKV